MSSFLSPLTDFYFRWRINTQVLARLLHNQTPLFRPTRVHLVSPQDQAVPQHLLVADMTESATKTARGIGPGTIALPMEVTGPCQEVEDASTGPHPHVQGVNSAPIANNRWGNNNAGAVAADGDANLGNRRTDPEQEAESASQPVPVLTTTLNALKPDLIPAASAAAASLLPTSGAPASGVETTEAKRARLREEARNAKLLLDRIAHEEANLEQEERRAQEERRREQEAQKLRKIEEDRRRQEQERRREEELRLRQERELEERHRPEYERDVRERERSALFPPPGLRDARPDFRGERPDRGFLPPQDFAFAREPLPPQGALSRDGRREGWDRRRASDGFGHGPGPAGDYPPPPLGERERVPMRDRLGGGPRDRVPFDQQQAPGPFGRRPLSPPPGHPSYDRRRSPPPGIYGPRGPPGPVRGGPLDHPMPPHMRGDVRDRDMRDMRDRNFRGRDIGDRDVRGGREPFFPPGPPGRGPESRGEPGFAGPPPRDLLRRLGKRVDHQLAEPMGGNLQRDDRRDVTPRRGPQQNNNAQTPQSRPLAERMSAVSSPSTPPLPPTAPASDPSLPVGSNEVLSAGDVIDEQQGKGQGGGQGQGQGQGHGQGQGQGQDKQERRRGGRKKRGGQGGRRDRGGGGGGGRNNGNGQGGASGGGGGGGEASEEKRGEDTVDPEGR
ncbi:hypothetical protein L198_00474 [Cryptococcus wingfieldii CBS 7118]|uniref:Uncharacterized protein n=1 Tax=Cryptococcus wingfieldii CBS 7118 TaxID=1295528 RepID=A0A1E3K6P6_9TREE|nr:hypothetical protein L198_00474 [Cryptococcus wingfieldii CBS 7118]ODO08741.1 hypothetical protein L198_00474 [Cryptococcus wingfieldii CBS 7118]